MDISETVGFLPGNFFVATENDNFGNPARYTVETIIPTSAHTPEHRRIVCRLPDGLDTENKQTAHLLAAAKELFDLVAKECDFCPSKCGSKKPDLDEMDCSYSQAIAKAKGLASQNTTTQRD